MKKIIAPLLLSLLLSLPLLAEDTKFGLNFDLRTPTYTENTTLYQVETSSYVAGLGIALYVPLGQGFSALYEGQFNTTGNYTEVGSTTKAIVKAHPLSASLQKTLGWWYFGAGVNYTFFDVTTGGIKRPNTGGLGGQVFGGWQNIFIKDLDIIAKYTLMGATVDGLTINLNSLSLGFRYWLEFPDYYWQPNKA